MPVQAELIHAERGEQALAMELATMLKINQTMKQVEYEAMVSEMMPWIVKNRLVDKARN